MKNRIILPIVFILFISFISCTRKVIEVRYAPVLFNLSAPDSLERSSLEVKFMFISAFDPDGLSDIDSVYYQVTKPDGSSNGRFYKMLDNGQAGDSVANDARFTYGLSTYGDTTIQLGNYIFTFGAKDKDGNDSNHPQAIVTIY